MSGKLLTTKQVQEKLGVSERTIYRLMDQDKLHPVKIGKSWKFEESDLDAYIDEQRKESARILEEKRQASVSDAEGRSQQSKSVA